MRAKAHALKPVVIIGDKGLTDTVMAEIDRALKAHELIKVKAATDDRDARSAWMEAICARLEAHPVQAIGKILVIWRENPRQPEPKKPAAKPAKKKVTKAKGRPLSVLGAVARAETATGSGRQRSRTPSPLPASEPRRRRPRTSR